MIAKNTDTVPYKQCIHIGKYLIISQYKSIVQLSNGFQLKYYIYTIKPPFNYKVCLFHSETIFHFIMFLWCLYLYIFC